MSWGRTSDSAYVDWRRTKANERRARAEAGQALQPGGGGVRGGGTATWTGKRTGKDIDWKQRVSKEETIAHNHITHAVEGPEAGATRRHAWAGGDGAGAASGGGGGGSSSAPSMRALIERLAPGWRAAENAAAAMELAQLCRASGATRRQAVQMGAVKGLVGLLVAAARESQQSGGSQSSSLLLEPVCACLSNLAQDAEGRRVINAAGAARPLVVAVRSSPRSSVVREASGALWNLSHKAVGDGVQQQLAAKAVPALVALLARADETVVVHALSALANIAADPSGRRVVGARSSGAVPAAAALLHGSGAPRVAALAAKLLAHASHGPRDAHTLAVAAQLSAANAVPGLVSLLNGAARDHAAACLGSLAGEGKLRKDIAGEIQKHSGGGVGGAQRAFGHLAASPRARTRVTKGPSWHPRRTGRGGAPSSASSRTRRGGGGAGVLGLDDPRGAAAGGRGGAKEAASARSRGWFSSSVELSGYWKERLAKEDMSSAQLRQCVARCRVGGKEATRQPRPWSQHMPDTSGTWGHVSAGHAAAQDDGF